MVCRVVHCKQEVVMTNEINLWYCECPTERVYGKDEVCEYCRTEVFHADPEYAEFMGFVLVDGKWA